ncbi:hypothetical protein ACFX11_032583 [Malus domestica]
MQVACALLECINQGLPLSSSPLRIRHLTQLLVPFIQQLLEEHQDLIFITQLLEIRLHSLQILISIDAARAPIHAQIVFPDPALTIFHTAINLRLLPLAQKPRLLPLPQLYNITKDIVRLPLRHVTVNLEQPAFSSYLSRLSRASPSLPKKVIGYLRNRSQRTTSCFGRFILSMFCSSVNDLDAAVLEDVLPEDEAEAELEFDLTAEKPLTEAELGAVAWR